MNDLGGIGQQGPVVVVTTMPLSDDARADLSAMLGNDYVVVDIKAAPSSANIVLTTVVSEQTLGSLRMLFPRARILLTELHDSWRGISYPGPLTRALESGPDGYFFAQGIESLPAFVQTEARLQLTGDTRPTPPMIGTGTAQPVVIGAESNYTRRMPEPLGTSHRLPQITDRQTWQARLDELRVKEKAHTRAGDALAAERRRLPMVEVDATTTLIGADGPVSLLDVFEGRSQLIAYFQMWHTGKPAAEQCEGCTFSTSHIHELSYLNSRDVSYATFCEGPYDESSRYRDFMGWTIPWYSVPQESVDELVAHRYFGILVCYLRDGDRVFETYWTTGRGNEVMAPSYGLLDLTVYGRQEFWEDAPEGWPQRWNATGGQFRLDGRPTSQWSRIKAGRSDDLGTATGA